ncbi:HAD-IIA family hydrolase [Nocardioides alcanivorans]|uniref:HAD-IIA family hydrolase n=1 Tax=Nocardioides alcanivorans TaxID=2897352 RepID=UPI001F28D6B0|nr:HAD-IIA family hydrolase [Nocardioides alcanivorans]
MAETPGLLIDGFDHLLLDLDGCVYEGPRAVPGAVPALARARAQGVTLSFVTNNAGRTPAQVAAHLVELGIDAGPDDVVTSAQGAAARLAELVPPGSPVFLVGGEGLLRALEEVGLRPVSRLDDDPVAVASGFGPELPWQRIVDAGILLRLGLPWVAGNADMTFPTGNGLAPGHGALVELLERFSDRRAEVTGKPAPGLFLEAVRRRGGRRPLVIGDRLDTDIAGARAAGLPSLLVMTGVTGPNDLAACPVESRPTHVGADLGALHLPVGEARWDPPTVGEVRPASSDAGGSVVP